MSDQQNNKGPLRAVADCNNRHTASPSDKDYCGCSACSGPTELPADPLGSTISIWPWCFGQGLSVHPTTDGGRA